MYDYIDALQQYCIETLWAEAGDPQDISRQRARTDRALRELRESFSQEQRKLFLAYEAEQNDLLGLEDYYLFRRTFLLAREIFR